jgi:hypothetical protein
MAVTEWFFGSLDVDYKDMTPCSLADIYQHFGPEQKLETLGFSEMVIMYHIARRQILERCSFY